MNKITTIFLTIFAALIFCTPALADACTGAQAGGIFFQFPTPDNNPMFYFHRIEPGARNVYGVLTITNGNTVTVMEAEPHPSQGNFVFTPYSGIPNGVPHCGEATITLRIDPAMKIRNVAWVFPEAYPTGYGGKTWTFSAAPGVVGETLPSGIGCRFTISNATDIPVCYFSLIGQ